MPCSWALDPLNMSDLLDLIADDDPGGTGQFVQLSTCESGENHRSGDEHVQMPISEAIQSNNQSFRGVRMVGRVGRGRHGTSVERKLLTLHMRGQKQARKDHKMVSNVLQTLKGSTFKKNGKTFRVGTKRGRKGCGGGSGVIITLTKSGQKGNRFTRRIPWVNFLEASFSKHSSSCNVAIAARLDVAPCTVPRLQKTCALEGMFFQVKMLQHLVRFCQSNPPVSVAKPLDFFYATLLLGQLRLMNVVFPKRFFGSLFFRFFMES